MTKQKQMTEQELDQVSGGGVWTKLDWVKSPPWIPRWFSRPRQAGRHRNGQ